MPRYACQVRYRAAEPDFEIGQQRKCLRNRGRRRETSFSRSRSRGGPAPRPADCRQAYRQFESRCVFLRYQGLAGGARSLERTRLRFQAKITCYCGFLMHLGPLRSRTCRFIVMIQRFNSLISYIGNTWKTRQGHDDNRPAAGPKQTDSTMANTAGTA